MGDFRDSEELQGLGISRDFFRPAPPAEGFHPCLSEIPVDSGVEIDGVLGQVAIPSIPEIPPIPINPECRIESMGCGYAIRMG
jgi:hypothetical protein